MAAKFIDINDFTGFYEVEEDFYNSDIVEKTEESILRDLLGNTLYAAFIADLNPSFVPQTQKWIDFRNGKDYTDDILMHYVGISEMIVAFSFYALITDTNNSNSTGFTKNNNENSTILNNYEKKVLAYNSYNRGVNLYIQAERFLSFYPDDFTNWYHKQKAYKKLINY